MKAFQDQVGDIRRAVRFIRHHAAEFGVDGQRLGISGSSSGGLLALAVGLNHRPGNPTAADVVDHESDGVRAIGCFFPPTDLLNFGASAENVVDLMHKQTGTVDASFQFYEADAKTAVRKPITAKDQILGLLREYSPVTHASAADPPTILIHGDQDSAVPVQQSRRLIERLAAVNVPARIVVREGVGHAYRGWEADSALIAAWFDEHLRAVR
jgi:acetyl esterase/lipase